MDVDTYDNGTLPCSLWLKGLPQETDEDQRWIAVLEPVDITVAKVMNVPLFRNVELVLYFEM